MAKFAIEMELSDRSLENINRARPTIEQAIKGWEARGGTLIGFYMVMDDLASLRQALGKHFSVKTMTFDYVAIVECSEIDEIRYDLSFELGCLPLVQAMLVEQLN